MRAKNCIFGAVMAAAAVVCFSGTARAMSLDTLVAAGPDNMIVVGNVVYSNFTYGGVLPSDITITTTPTGLSFTSTTGAISNSGVISYDVTVTGADIQSVGLDFTATATGGAAAYVGETVTDNTTSQNYSLQVYTDGPGGLPDNDTDSVTLDPASDSLHVIKSIDIASAGSGTATITMVDNTYVQTGGGSPPPVPEPMSLALLPLALIGLGLRKKLSGAR